MSRKSFYLCIDVGGTKVLGVVFDENNEIVYKEKIKTGAHEGPENVEKNIFQVLDKLFQYTQEMGTVLSIAMGIPGFVDEDSGNIVYSPNIGWRNYPIRNKIFERYKVPCYIGNDVNLGLLGEWKYGQKKLFRNCIGIFVGTGIGGAIIIDNKLYTGSNNWAGEIGHMVIERDGPKCSCGNLGCLEAMAGKSGITRYVKEQIAIGRDTILSETIDEDVLIRGKHLKKALEKRDLVACEAMEMAAVNLARGAGILISIFNPEAIIFGGGVIEATGDFIMPQIIENTSGYCISEAYSTTKILKAAMGDYSAVYGARALIDSNY